MSSWLRADLDDTASERLASLPPRVSRPSAALIVATVTFFSAVGFASGGFSGIPLWTAAVLGGMTLLARRRPEPYPLHVGLLCTLAAVAAAMPGFGIHPFPLLSALAAYAVVVLIDPRLRQSADWAHSGVWGPGVARLALLTALLPLLGLPAWRLLASSDIAWVLALIADIPIWIVPVVGIFFALVNALSEELAFRGVLMDAAVSALGVRGGLALQAAAFGLAHVGGVPGGLWGVVMSSVYGLLLGVIRLRARGIAACCAAHVLADLILFGWLVIWAL